MLFSQELIETVRKLDAAEILAFRPLIHEAEVLHRAAEALMEACVLRYDECLNVGDLFTSLAYIWDFSFDFPGISIWSLLQTLHRASDSASSCLTLHHDNATAMVLSTIPVESCGIDFNEKRERHMSPLMHAVEANFGPKTISALIRLGATFSADDSPKIMPAIASSQHLQTMRELLLLASKTRLVDDASQPLNAAGSTALHLCCTDFERVKLLLGFGVCPLRRDANGSSARQCVQIQMAMLQLRFSGGSGGGSGGSSGSKYLEELKKLRLCYNALLRAEEDAVKTTIYLV